MKIEISEKERKQLIKSQQGELDAVILYRRLAEMIEDSEKKEIFLRVAADEGRHASIIRKYTGENLRPRKFLSFFIVTIYKIFGLKFTLNILSKGEFRGAISYSKIAEKIPDIKEMLKDEELHGNLMKDMLC